MEIGFRSLYQKGHLKSYIAFKKLYSLEKVHSLGMEERVSLKKDRNRWERGALMLCIIVKEKIVESL